MQSRGHFAALARACEGIKKPLELIHCYKLAFSYCSLHPYCIQYITFQIKNSLNIAHSIFILLFSKRGLSNSKRGSFFTLSFSAKAAYFQGSTLSFLGKISHRCRYIFIVLHYREFYISPFYFQDHRKAWQRAILLMNLF